MMRELGPSDGRNRHVLRVHSTRAHGEHKPLQLDKPVACDVYVYTFCDL